MKGSSRGSVLFLGASAVLAFATPVEASSAVVYVGDWARPNLSVHETPGSLVHSPGRVLGNMLPGWDASADCYTPHGAALNVWGQHRKDWVKIKWGWTGYAWVWGGGLRAYPGLPDCTP